MGDRIHDFQDPLKLATYMAGACFIGLLSAYVFDRGPPDSLPMTKIVDLVLWSTGSNFFSGFV